LIFNTKLKLLVGQQGQLFKDSITTINGPGYGRSGGGGSFITNINNNPLVIAGGGGGVGCDITTYIDYSSGSYVQDGQSQFIQGSDYNYGGKEGNGYIINTTMNYGGAAGFYTDGGSKCDTTVCTRVRSTTNCINTIPCIYRYGKAFINGGNGGLVDPSIITSSLEGGFGGASAS